MRRIVIACTALAVLATATAAYAAFNSYGGSHVAVSPNKPGTSKKPVAVKMVEVLNAQAPSGDRAAPLKDIKLTIYGMVSNGKFFPKCSDSIITSNHTKWDKSCPKGSLIGSGPVHAELGPASNPSAAAGTACNLVLHVYNGGQGKLVFFFTTPSATSCGGLTTGASAPYDGTVKRVGKNLVTNVPLPPDVSTKAGNLEGVYGSLITENLTFFKLSKKVHGRRVPFQGSNGCKNGKRPWSITFTAQDYGSTNTETQTVSGSQKCS